MRDNYIQTSQTSWTYYNISAPSIAVVSNLLTTPAQSGVLPSVYSSASNLIMSQISSLLVSQKYKAKELINFIWKNFVKGGH